MNFDFLHENDNYKFDPGDALSYWKFTRKKQPNSLKLG